MVAGPNYYYIGNFLPLQFLGSRVFQPLHAFIGKHLTPWKVIPFLLLCISGVFTLLYYSQLKFIVWKTMLIDCSIPLGLLLLVALLSDGIADMWNYCCYERGNLMNHIYARGKDVHLEVWEDTKYYDFLEQDMLKPCYFGQDTFIFSRALETYRAQRAREAAAPAVPP